MIQQPLIRAPGVTFETADPPAWSVSEVRTDVAGFVGITERGPLHEPVRVESLNQFSTRFGRSGLLYGHLPNAVAGFFANGGRTAWIVRAGAPLPDDSASHHAALLLIDELGDVCYRITARDPGWGGATLSIEIRPGRGGEFDLLVSALSGDADPLLARERRSDILEQWRGLSADDGSRQSLLMQINGLDRPPGLAPQPWMDDFPHGRMWAGPAPGWQSHAEPSELRRNRGSQHIRAERLHRRLGTIVGVRHVAGVAADPPGAGGRTSRSGHLGWPEAKVHRNAPAESMRARSVLNGLTVEHFIGDVHYAWGLRALEKINEVGLIAIPDLMWEAPPVPDRPPDVHPCRRTSAQVPDSISEIEPRESLSEPDRRTAQLAMLAHCSAMRDRFAILDPWPLVSEPDEAAGVAGRAARRVPGQNIARVMAQRGRLDSHLGQHGALYFPAVGQTDALGRIRWLPPSGHIAGMIANTDLQFGVQRSPANLLLRDVSAVQVEMTAGEHAELNESEVNAVLSLGPRGIRAMGARTLANRQDAEESAYQYIAVRRLVTMIAESLQRSAPWLVHVENTPQRWRDTTRLVREFLLRQWRAGRLGGESPDAAFSVICDATSNPPEQVERGELVCFIGLQPPLPAEFVVVRIGRLESGV